MNDLLVQIVMPEMIASPAIDRLSSTCVKCPTLVAFDQDLSTPLWIDAVFKQRALVSTPYQAAVLS